MNAKAIVSGAIILFIGNLLSAILGLFREMLIAAHYGAAHDTDAYIFANTVPSIILAFVSAIFLTGFIPLFIKERVHKSAEEASFMFSNIMNWFVIIMLIVTAACYLLSAELSAFFAADPAAHRKIEQLLWILLAGMIFFGLSYAQSTVLNSVNHFTTPAFLTVINNTVVILFMVLFRESMGIYSVAWGFVTGNVVQVVVQIPVLRAKGIRYRRYFNIRAHYLRKLFSLSMPIVALVLIDQTMVFATRYFAAYLDPGSASAIHYANRIVLLPVTLFGTALISATYPSAVQVLAENRQREYNMIVTTGIKSLLLILAPMFFICLFFSTDIVRALFERGAFDAEATHMTASVFMIMSVCIIFMPLRDFFNKLFFSRSRLGAPILYSLGYATGFIAGCFWLVPLIGYIGIAVSAAASLLLAFVYLVWAYKRQNREQAIGVPLSFIIKIGAAAAFSSAVMYEAYIFVIHMLNMGRWAEIAVLALFTGAALALYVATVKWWRIREMDLVWNKMAEKLPIKRHAGAAAMDAKV